MTEEGYPLEAVILVTTKLGELWNVAEEAGKIEGVKFARPVAGRYDVVVHAQTNHLSWVIARLHSIKGVASTESLIALECKFEK
ncbi:MAG TPA: Lrp/AsnC ligand binding domain-containing protein [Verrucomicrobiae bacterium]|nr:Lrp/AsnC ligand binding domain-containing protein [Verrucomicrobiae bacterium]